MTAFSLQEGLSAPLPLSLYIHLPWCIRKCPYCDFNSHQKPDESRGAFSSFEDRYLDALEADCDASCALVWGRPVDTIFIGGGTPSLFSAKAIDRLLSILRSRFQLRPLCEITLEANPGTFEAERYEGFARAGVNRLSIGVQSFSDEALKRLGRVHNAAQAKEAIQLARRCFDSFNIDLMYGLPGQDLAALKRELDTALSFEAPHLSYYQLTLEPNTMFASFPPVLPDEDLIAKMQDCIEAATAAAGMEHYEVSAYARADKHCEHNLNYWQFGDYLGLGAGAHGKLSFHDRVLRQQKFRHPDDYMACLLEGKRPAGQVGAAPMDPFLTVNPAIELERVLQPDDLVFEFFLNALRLRNGVPSSLFGERTGLSITRLQSALRDAGKRGLITPDPTRLAPSRLGFQFLNDLQMLFLADDD